MLLKEKSVADFSKKAISRAVLKQSSQHPAVMYPVGVAALGGLALLLLGGSTVAIATAVGGGVFALGGWMVNQFLRRDKFATSYVNALRHRLVNEHHAMLSEMSKQLGDVGSDAGSEQLGRLEEKFETFKSILTSKLNETELTYGRYLGIAEQVFLGTLDNLQKIAHVLRGMRTIDPEYLERRISELEGHKGEAQQREVTSLRTRRQLLDEQEQKVAHWLAQNEAAMTRLDHASVRLAEMDSIRGHASLEMETAMAELQRMADEAHEYAVD